MNFVEPVRSVKDLEKIKNLLKLKKTRLSVVLSWN